MSDIQLDYSDITDIFKEKLKIDNIVKKISAVFLNQRYASKIDYKPYFQRNYVWDDEKATYFIESILLGTEIPPLVFFQTRTETNEVIDGRQRYETIERFLNDKLTLSEKGLLSLKSLAGKRYSQLDSSVQASFEDTRIRILQFRVVNEPKLDESKEDKIKKEIFRRYNSGITPLVKYDIARAAYIDDELTKRFVSSIEEDSDLYEFLRIIMVPKRQMQASNRDQVNIMVTLIRDLITLPLIPIGVYSKASARGELVHKYYAAILSQRDPEEEIRKFTITVKILKDIYNKCSSNNVPVKENKLFYEVMFWGIYIISEMKITITDNNIDSIISYVKNAETEEVWKTIKIDETRDFNRLFDSTGSHYYSAINNRYRIIANILEKVFKVSFDKYVKSTTIEDIPDEKMDSVQEIQRYKLNKPLPETLTIEDILSDMKKSRFLIRPDYQRSEVKDLQKASYLMESILLGFTIPPLFVYKRKEDNVREVVDGQQRLLTILGFLGRTYLNEKGDYVPSDKDRFSLSKLKILSELNGLNILTIEHKFEDDILEFPMDIIEIDGEQNPEFSPIDLFLRLNTKPYPIKENTFEMWNAYIDRRIVLKVKEIAQKYQGIVFRVKDDRMKLEELITSLAYLDYRMNKGGTFSQIVNVYRRNDRMCSRIMSKDQMTKILGEASENEPESFLNSVNNVEIFAEKVMQLLNQNSDRFRDLVNHSRKGAIYKTDQNYYFLWILLRNLSPEYILEHREEVYERIQRVFAYVQKASDEIDVQQFIRLLTDPKTIVNKKGFFFKESAFV